MASRRSDRHDVRWTINQPSLTGTERCQLHRDPDGWQLTGTVVGRLDGHQLGCGYRIHTAEDWATRSVTIELEWGGSLRHLQLTRDDHDRWTIAGRVAPELDGCSDIDLGITPATNTLPIRRLDLAHGQHADVDVAWVDFPSLTIRRSHQTYTRLSTWTWHYRSGTHASELDVDDAGLVTTYGNGLWHRNDLARDATPSGPKAPPPGGRPC